MRASIFTLVLSLSLFAPSGEAAAQRYTQRTISGDIIVLDALTGLMWQHSTVSGQTWVQALAYCESLSYAGFDDWRLPQVNSLASLVAYDKSGPASDFPNMPSEYFWTSSSYAASPNSAWNVYFNSGRVNYYNKFGSYFVRCVR